MSPKGAGRGLAGRRRRDYLGAMPLPRPSSPRALWADLKAFWRDRPRHQWIAAVLAVLVPVGIIVTFLIDSNTNLRPIEQVIYVDSWPASRSGPSRRFARRWRP